MIKWHGDDPNSVELKERVARDRDDPLRVLPFDFRSTLEAHLLPYEEVLECLFTPSERVLQERLPGQALVLTPRWALAMYEGETPDGDQKWGVRTRFHPYRQILGLELGWVLLRGHFTIYGGGMGDSVFRLHWYDLDEYRRAARLIRERIGG
jgi:hypothetical protein